MIKTMATVFSGIGAPEAAYPAADVIFACEIDKYARKSYIAIHGEPLDEFYNDIRDLDGTKYNGKIDLLVGGSPCQDFSIAGRQEGFLGFMGSLTYELLRVIKEVKPKVFVFENVKNILAQKF